MSLPANTVWEVRTTGSDTNGGGFVAGLGGTDYSQQDHANTVGSNISTTDVVANGTTTLTSASGAFTSAINGNILYFAGGSGSLAAGWYQATYVSATTITVDRTVPSGTGITMNVGGALASPGQAAALRVAGNTVWVRAGTYTITSASTNVSGGCVSDAAGGAGLAWAGYNSARGDYGTPPVLQAGSITGFTIFTVAAGATAGWIVANIVVDGASKTTSQGIQVRQAGVLYRCQAKNCTNFGIINLTTLSQQIGCSVTGCSSTFAFRPGIALGCEVYGNTASGIDLSGGLVGASCTNCLSYSNSGASSDGFLCAAPNAAMDCTAYGNGRDGFRANSSQVSLSNCVSEGNSGFGFGAGGSVRAGSFLLNCAGYNNTSGNVDANLTGPRIGFITAVAECFVAPASGNFALNALMNGGALLRATGYPSSFPRGTTVAFGDIGAAQSRAPWRAVNFRGGIDG